MPWIIWIKIANRNKGLSDDLALIVFFFCLKLWDSIAHGHAYYCYWCHRFLHVCIQSIKKKGPTCGFYPHEKRCRQSYKCWPFLLLTLSFIQIKCDTMFFFLPMIWRIISRTWALDSFFLLLSPSMNHISFSCTCFCQFIHHFHHCQLL